VGWGGGVNGNGWGEEGVNGNGNGWGEEGVNSIG
jgi:hypothetical protein